MVWYNCTMVASEKVVQMQNAIPSLDTFDVQHRYYADTDTLSVYFSKASPGVIAMSQDIAPGILVDYTNQKQVVSIDVFTASERSSCHFYNNNEMIDNKPQLAITWDYAQVHDQLIVYLHPSITAERCVVKTEDHYIELCLDTTGLLWALIFNNASQTVLCSNA